MSKAIGKPGIILVLFLSFHSIALADSYEEVIALQMRWAEVNYLLSGTEQLDAFEDLAMQADLATAAYPQSAEALIWSGIIKSTYAGAKGGLGALSLAKASRKALERAMEIDPLALDGSAYTSLGTLYFSVPGWPLGFGDDKKARELLTRALEIAPGGIDQNYFYAEYLVNQKNYEQARSYYLRAQQAPARPGREVADQGRQQEIAKALVRLEHEL